MKQIKISNIENHTNLFNENNDRFDGIKWLEPLFIVMTSAYDEDTEFELQTNNQYLFKMLTSTYEENKTYSPVEKVKTRQGLEKISSHLTSIMLQNFGELSFNDKKDLRDYLQYLFLELKNLISQF